MDCLFCKIANKEIPSDIICEDAGAVAVLDIHPRAPGHTMVLPKSHRETILELASDEAGRLIEAVNNAIRILNKGLRPDGFTIGINHGKAAGQAVDHLHIHIVPRWRNDGGGSIHSVVNNPPKESLKEMKSKIQISKSK